MVFAIVLKNVTVRGVFIAVLSAVFSYIAGHAVARRIVSKKKNPSVIHAFVIAVLWFFYAFLILWMSSGKGSYIVNTMIFPSITFYLIGYMIGGEGSSRIFRVHGQMFEGEGVVETVLWTVVIPILMVLAMMGLDIVLRYMPLNQFINPELWKNSPFSSQKVFLDLLWSGLFIIAAYVIALAASIKQKTKTAKRRWFWTIMTIAFVVLAIWWINAKYVDPRTMQVHYMGKYAVDIIMHMVLPILTLTILSFAGSMLVMRDTMLEIIKEDYVTTARAKGLPDYVVRDKHAARNALLPLVTNFVISLGFTVSGGIITETMFSWPGMGMAYLEALRSQDIPLLVGLLVFTGIFVLFAHLIADILYAFLDPRIRY
jgi:peptide/nickel transport system permease protein